MLTFGVVGTGLWGTKVIKAIRALGYDVRVCNRNGEFEDQSVCRDYRKLIPEVDIVWVATHPSTNCEIAAYAIEHNKPTVVEKPVAFTSQQVAGLVRASKAKQVPLIVDYIHLFNDGLLKTMGKSRPCVISAFSEITGVFLEPVDNLLVSLTTDVPERDYSALWDMGSHAVAIAIDAFREPPIGLGAIHNNNYAATLRFGDALCTIALGMNSPERKVFIQLVGGHGGVTTFHDGPAYHPLQRLIGHIASLHLRNEFWTNGDLAVEVTDVLERLHKLLPQT